MSNQATIKSIPLNDISPAKSNVRTVETNNEKDKALIASIKANGVLQNLNVYKEGDKYFAVSGGRRYAACKHLAKTKQLPKDFKVVCRVITKEQSTDVSLSENYHREDMHPADEFEAFSKLVSEGKTIKAIATEYGIKQIHVKQRLALADVAPEVLTAFKSKDIDLDTVMAFTLEPNKAKQAELLNEHGGSLRAHTVRSFFTREAESATSRLATFVGLKNYKAAGGVVIADLFSDSRYLSDNELITRLSIEKMEQLKEDQLKLGWSWCEFSLEQHSRVDGNVTYEEKDDSKIPSKLTKKVEEAEKRMSDIDYQFNVDGELTEDDEEKIQQEYEALETLCEDLETQIEGHRFFTDEQKQRSGVFLSLNYNGTLNVQDGIVKVVKEEAETNNSGESKSTESDDSISQALTLELRQYANQLTQLELIKNPELAALVYQFEACYESLSGLMHYEWAHTFQVSRSREINNDDKVKDAQSYNELIEAVGAIDRSWVKKSVEQSFIAFAKLTPKKRAIIFGSVVACSANDVPEENRTKSAQNEVNKRTKFDRADYWRPTVANYLGRIPKTLVEKTAEKVIGKKWVDGKTALTKKQLATELATVLDGSNKEITKEAQSKANKWLPEELE